MKNYFNTNNKIQNLNKADQSLVTNQNAVNNLKDDPAYGYYSKVLMQPYDTLDELKKAEATYYAEQRAKEDKAATKKADAQKVEEAFKELNATRKVYKSSILDLTKHYTENLKELKKGFEFDKKAIEDNLSAAETAYSTALKEFTDKYPEGYHLTLKDGDFETTISSHSSSGKPFEELSKIFSTPSFFDFEWLF